MSLGEIAADRPAAPPGAWDDPKQRWHRLAPFVCLYVSFGATLGLIGGGAPIILRDRGVPLTQVGLLQLIYLPLGLTFLWAMVIDRTRLPVLPHRIGWIVATQALSVALLIVLSAGETWPVVGLFAIAVAISLAFATMDIALEALVVETVPSTARSLVTTAKLCGSSVGGMIGAGLLTAVYGRLGWQGSLGVVALIDTICLAPILFYPEDRCAPHKPLPASPNTTWRFRSFAVHAALIGFYFAASALVFTSDSLVLLDLHVARPTVAFVTGTLGPGINLAAVLASGALMTKVPANRLVIAMAVGVAASGALMITATSTDQAGLGLAAVVLGAIAASGLGVPVFAALYRWAQGASAATNYSLLFGIGFLAAVPARVGGPALAEWLGWPAFFALATPLHMASLWLLALAMRRTEQADRPGRVS